MGPQLDSCGRILAQGRFLLGLEASMGPQLDSCGRPMERKVRPWRDVLQWGRNLIVAEGSRIKTRIKTSPKLQWGRNLIVAEGVRRWLAGLASRARFNGAAT